MNINIEDYLTDSEIKQICKDYVKDMLYSKNEHHKERILGNIAYNAAFEIIDDAIDENDKIKIKEKVLEVVNNPSSYSVFRKKDAWGMEDSEAYIEVKRSIEEYKPLINEKVKQAIVSKDYEKEIDNTHISDFIIEALRKGISEVKE